MKVDIHIPAGKRDWMARRALVIFEAAQTRAEALRAIEVEFDVSASTARNLVGRGQFLRDKEDHREGQ
jgi:hypothetical protein